MLDSNVPMHIIIVTKGITLLNWLSIGYIDHSQMIIDLDHIQVKKLLGGINNVTYILNFLCLFPHSYLKISSDFYYPIMGRKHM